MERSLTNQSILITGANGGMGFETTQLLYQQGAGSIIMATRTQSKGDEAKARLLASNPAQSTIVEAVGGFDMNDPRAIEEAVAKLPKQHPFDVVFLQAGGVVFGNERQTVNWNGLNVERTISQNALGGYATLVNLLKRGLIAEDATIVFAGGEGARGIPGLIPKPEFSGPDEFRNYVVKGDNLPAYHAMAAMGTSKLSSAILSSKLAEIAEKTGFAGRVLWFTPGLTYGTNGLATTPPIQRFFMEKVAFGIMGLLGLAQSPKAGAQKFVDSLTGKIGRNGDIIGAPEGKALGKLTNQKPMNAALTDPALRETFWQIVQEAYAPFPVEFAHV
ncbi:SDR family NAD(P)-dependent oxidoreductase [Pontibacter sp. G13]|uniref:SDR family NAD(P)-dependent oxidoreductase n=1 Tax=Pontibacter sp. G13 TaxID=3074898 RepID=UPI002889FF24|nr:SDR family NAD(P)-dependent oxidoreductase [Pontibacter sp. G13]WNJ20299.1 SDR family NAD(P)-dependent oxidoreductase [Pontibacter sp. G13]